MAAREGGGERILVIGASGQVATALAEEGAASRHAIATAGRPDLDLTREDTIAPAIDRFGPTVIVNAAAYTAVDRAEEDVEAAFALNRDGPAALARIAAAAGIPLVHLSTDYVFDGSGDRPFREDDPTGPRSVYGRSKRAGEEAVLAEGEPAIVARTAWVYGPSGHNFVKTMLRVAATRDRLTVVDDQVGNPTAAPDIAAALLALVERAQAAGWPRGSASLLHLAGTGETSWCGLARHVLAVSAARGGPAAEVAAIATADWPTPAERPRNSRLDTRRLAEDWGIVLPPWQDSVERTVARLLAEGFPPPA